MLDRDCKPKQWLGSGQVDLDGVSGIERGWSGQTARELLWLGDYGARCGEPEKYLQRGSGAEPPRRLPNEVQPVIIHDAPVAPDQLGKESEINREERSEAAACLDRGRRGITRDPR